MAIHLYLVRHGESAGNAGLPTEDHRTIPLTEKGKRQAEDLARQWKVEPDTIFVSPFQRAQDTALPTMARFPKAKIRILDDLQEFTYLSPATCVNTTKEQRRPRVEAYWERLRPDEVDGADAESFRQLAERTQHFLQEVRKLPDQSVVFAFSHMMCITCIRSWIEHPEYSLMERMKTFRSFPFIENTEVLAYTIEQEG